jgi:hypothetical protein
VISEPRLEAACPSALPVDPADRVRRLLVVTNSSSDQVRALHKSLVKVVHPDKCSESWRCFFENVFKIFRWSKFFDPQTRDTDGINLSVYIYIQFSVESPDP